MKELSQKKTDELKTSKEEFEEKMQEMNRKNIKITEGVTEVIRHKQLL